MLRDRLALTEEGARSLRKGALVCALANLVLMFPVGVFYLVTGEFLAHWEDGAVPLPTLWPYLALIAVVLAAVFATQYWEYHATYSVVYQESARKRIGLAERLRVLPLSFFGKRDLADLTTVIMKDAADQERLFSHTMPQAFGTGISTVIVAVMLLVFDWRLACASLWPVPVALLILPGDEPRPNGEDPGQERRRPGACRRHPGVLGIEPRGARLEPRRRLLGPPER